MDKRLVCSLVGLGVLVVAAGVVTAAVVTKKKGSNEEEDKETDLEVIPVED